MGYLAALLALCVLIAVVFAFAACLLSPYWTETAVTPRRFILLTLWGTVVVFGSVVL